MTDTVRERVLAAVYARLGTIAGVETLARNPDDLFSREQMPAVAQFDGGHDRADAFSGEEGFVMSVDIEVSVSERTRDLTTAAVDAWYGKIAAAMAAGNRTLGGLVSDVVEVAFVGPEFLREKAEHPYAAFVVTFHIRFATADGDPYSLPGE